MKSRKTKIDAKIIKLLESGRIEFSDSGQNPQTRCAGCDNAGPIAEHIAADYDDTAGDLYGKHMPCKLARLLIKRVWKGKP